MKYGLAVSIITKALAYDGNGLPWWSGGVPVKAINSSGHIWYVHPIQDEVCGGTNAMTQFGSHTLRVYFTNACDGNNNLLKVDERVIERILSTFVFID